MKEEPVQVLELKDVDECCLLLMTSIELFGNFAFNILVELLLAETALPSVLLYFTFSVGVEKFVVSGALFVPEDETTVVAVAGEFVIAPEDIGQIMNVAFGSAGIAGKECLGKVAMAQTTGRNEILLVAFEIRSSVFEINAATVGTESGNIGEGEAGANKVETLLVFAPCTLGVYAIALLPECVEEGLLFVHLTGLGCQLLCNGGFCRCADGIECKQIIVKLALFVDLAGKSG